MELMDHIIVITGCVLVTYVSGRNVSWVEMLQHRDSIHAADFNITSISTNVGCIALCTSTTGCAYVTYTYGSSTCIRHTQLQGKQVQSNSRVWKRPPMCVSPFEYNEVMGVCTYFSTARLNWEDAKTNCESRQSRLLVTDTQTKYTETQSSYTGVSLFWVGGYPRASDGQWVWLTGDLIDSSMFHPGQPSGGPGRLAFWKNNGILRLDDTFPHELHYFICESL